MTSKRAAVHEWCSAAPKSEGIGAFTCNESLGTDWRRKLVASDQLRLA